MGAPLGHARHRRQDQLLAVERLDLRLLVDTHDQGHGWGRNIKGIVSACAADVAVRLATRARRHKPEPAFAAWVESVDVGAAFLSVITVLELERGVLQLQRRDPTQGTVLRAWLDEEILPHFGGRLLLIDHPVATACAGLRVPNPRPPHDALIAAAALVHDLT